MKKSNQICDVYIQDSALPIKAGYSTDAFCLKNDDLDKYPTKMHVYHLAKRNSNGTTTYYPNGYEITGKLLVNSYE